jgi:hypothetical protein
MRWRKWNYLLHRDIGFFCIGLTLIYAVSGIAVNHTSHGFNPSYTIEKSSGSVTPLQPGKTPDQDYTAVVLKELQIAEPLKNGAMLSPETIRIFTERYTIDVTLPTGQALVEKVQRRPLLFEWNFLHLNKAKGLWTWIADLYGGALALLAVTGLLMLHGKTRRRGLLLTAAGILLPLGYLFIAL